MVTPAGYSFKVETLTRRLARLKIGPFLKELTKNMLKVMHTDNSKTPGHTINYDDVDGVEPLKMHIYSAHDLNIASILNGLGFYDGKCPVYTSAILFELHYDPTAEAHLVKIFYRNTTDIQEPSQLFIPKCGLNCPLDQFVKLYKDLIPDDWERECNPKIYLFPLVFVLLIVGVLIMYGLHKWMISQLTIKFQKQCNRDVYEIFVASVNAQDSRLRDE